MAERAARAMPIMTGLKTGRSGNLLAALDIGCSKIGCLIARFDEDDPLSLRLAGGGHQSSRGFEAGSITDMDALERAIRLAVEQAERQAGESISDVIVGISALQVSARLVRGEAEIGGREVTPRDVRRVMAEAMAGFDSLNGVGDGEVVLAATPIAFALENAEGVRDPVGMIATRLGVLINVVHAPNIVVRNLRQCISRAHLNVAAIVPSASASGLGALVADERENGAICIDMGSGVTAISAFINGVPAWFSGIPVGGGHVTRDIAQGLGTTVAAAERMKTVHGSAVKNASAAGEMIDCPLLGDDGRLELSRITRGELTRVIAPRIEEIFEHCNRALSACSLRGVLPRRVVLTGGASQLPGIKETAQRVLSRPVRLARPVLADKLGETFAHPAFSTAAGLLTYPIAGLPDAGRGRAAQGKKGSQDGGGVVSRAYGWFRENF